MLFHIFLQLTERFSFLRMTHYISFRAIVALLTSLLLTLWIAPFFIRTLKKYQIGQVVRSDGPKSHFNKAGTPTMGGLLLLFGVSVPAFFWMDLTHPFTWQILILFLGLGALGFFDDYRKIKKQKSDGVAGKIKLIVQIALTAAILLWHVAINPPDIAVVHAPFLKHLTWDLGFLYVLFGVFVITGSSNAVNLTDGLDGLAIGPVMIAAACYAGLSYVSGHVRLAEYLYLPYVPGGGELAIFASCLVGSGLGFLWYNAYPAQVFMGDVGSLPLGGILGALAVFSRHELLLILVGGVFVAETLSVIGQVLSFRLTGKRIFRMAPLHHHFELCGWVEPKIIVRFWIVALVLGLLGILSLKIR